MYRTMKSFIFLAFCILALSGAGCATRNFMLTETREKIREQQLIVRVAIERGIREFDLEIQEGFIVQGVQKESLPTRSRILVTDTSVRVNDSFYSTPVIITSAAPILLNGNPYYGRLRMEGGLLVNEIPLEEYLEGVLSSEVYENWPIEALKAQAVVSRTYVLVKTLQNREEPYDVESTEVHQKFVYNVNSQHIHAAVEHTRSLFILLNGKPIEAFFHSSSGGITESCGEIFQQDLPYLRSIPDPYSREHENVFWTLTKSGEEIKRALKGIVDEKYESWRLNNIELSDKTSSGRVKEFSLLFGEQGRQIVRAHTFRLALDPKIFRSLLILEIQTEKTEDDTLFTFSGLGYGHGVGMSQWGAMNMALEGFTFENILTFYYRGTELGHYRVF